MNKQQPLILIVDDTELNREMLKDMLKGEYRIIDAGNGREAVQILEQRAEEVSIVLLDVVMPEMDGFELLAYMNRNHLIEEIPVVMISAETSPDYISRGYELGAVDYISRPFDSSIIKRRLENTIVLYTKQKMLQSAVTEQIRDKERNNALMVNILSTIVEFRNGESGVHVLRIRVITEILLETLMQRYPWYDLKSTQIAVISNAAALHDVGKIVIPEEILNKPGRLTQEEFNIMKTHTVRGAEMLQSLHIGKDEELVQNAYHICRWHHERWDGRGYPDGLRGQEIPLSAQVVSLADVYDALTSVRVYKPPYSHEKAIQMILNGECGMFNPDIIDCLLQESANLEERIKLHSENLDKLFNVDKISKEVMVKKNPVAEDRTVFLLEQERTKNQFLASLSSDMLFDYNAESDRVTFSEKGSAVLGLGVTLHSAREHLLSSPLMLKGDAEQFLVKIKRTSPERPVLQMQCQLCLPSGEHRWYELTVRTLWSNGIPPMMDGCIGKLTDIHEQTTASARLLEQASRDSLTGLYNYVTAKDMVELSLGQHPEQHSALFLMDVDNFKEINEDRGHLFGDQLLQHLTQVLSESIRKTDIAARVGGDEFILFLKNIPQQSRIEEQVNRIFQVVSKPFDGCLCSISMGIAVYPQDGTTYAELLNHADQALYASKNAGKKRFAFYDETGGYMAFRYGQPNKPSINTKEDRN